MKQVIFHSVFTNWGTKVDFTNLIEPSLLAMLAVEESSISQLPEWFLNN